MTGSGAPKSRKYSSEQLWKYVFVENELSDVFRTATRGYVDYLDYEVDGAEEFVVCRIVKANGDYDSLRVNVTSDSQWAILKDVMRAVAARYE